MAYSLRDNADQRRKSGHPNPTALEATMADPHLQPSGEGFESSIQIF
jgi:hypothetical protein